MSRSRASQKEGVLRGEVRTTSPTTVLTWTSLRQITSPITSTACAGILQHLKIQKQKRFANMTVVYVRDKEQIGKLWFLGSMFPWCACVECIYVALEQRRWTEWLIFLTMQHSQHGVMSPHRLAGRFIVIASITSYGSTLCGIFHSEDHLHLAGPAN